MSNAQHELHILEEIERNPETTQANLAAQLGVAVGSVNWYVKRLIIKGYVKVTHLQRRKLHYFLTPSGLAKSSCRAAMWMGRCACTGSCARLPGKPCRKCVRPVTPLCASKATTKPPKS